MEASKLEQECVHKVYEEIATHFSSTRHSPWPRIVEFLRSLPKGSIVADVGCGNGKYLVVGRVPRTESCFLIQDQLPIVLGCHIHSLFALPFPFLKATFALQVKIC
uniref:Uncharacterized protein n=1 Tax=Accipiter nisus TaxID=211598 RepID=A0A8B9RS82_9AVES